MKVKKNRRRPVEVSFKVKGDDALQWVLEKLLDKLHSMDGVKDLKVGLVTR
jgi:hypothetical protein